METIDTKQEVIVILCSDTELEDVINNSVGGWQNVLEIKSKQGGDNTPFSMVIAKKTVQNENETRVRI